MRAQMDLKHQALQVCKASGLEKKKLEKRLATLKDLQQGLEESIRQAERAASEAQFWGWAVVGARIVQISCDWAIMALSKPVDTIAPGAGTGISYVYDISKLIVDGANADLTAFKAVKFSTDAKLDAVGYHLMQTGKKSQVAVLDKIRKTYKVAEDVVTLRSDIKGAIESADGINSARLGLLKTLRSMKAQIEEIELLLYSCNAPFKELLKG